MDARTYKVTIAHTFLSVQTIGSAFNLIAFAICLRKNLRTIPTFVFYMFITPFDAIAMLFSTTYKFMTDINGVKYSSTSETNCKLAGFINRFAFHTAAWILVMMTLERCLSVKVLTWRKRMNAKKAAIASLVIVFVVFFALFHLNFGTDYVKSEVFIIGNSSNMTRTVYACVPNSLISVTVVVMVYTYSIGPWIILGIANLVLIHEIVKEKKSAIKTSKADQEKKRALTISLITTSILYILLKLPFEIVQGFFFSIQLTDPFISKFNDTFALLTSFYSSSHFFVLAFTNRLFQRELLSVFSFLRKSKPTAEKSMNTVSTSAVTKN